MVILSGGCLLFVLWSEFGVVGFHLLSFSSFECCIDKYIDWCGGDWLDV